MPERTRWSPATTGLPLTNKIAFANSLGMTVIVTDHHEVPYDEKDGVRQYRVPEARAVVDPKQEDCGYPFPEICGAVVAYKLVLALLARKEGRDWREVMESEIGLELLELSAFATIGDVMELKEENRIIVKSGIELMKDTRNAGLKALMQATETDPMHLKPYTIGFVLGPASMPLEGLTRRSMRLNFSRRRIRNRRQYSPET